LKRVVPQKPDKVLEGFCPEPEEQVVVNSNGRMFCLGPEDI